MSLLAKLFGRTAKHQSAPQKREMVSLVVLSNTHVDLTLDELRAHLDALFPGEFLPPRQQGNFVIDGSVPGAQFVVQSNVAGAAGFFMLNAVPGPYKEFSDFAEYIADPALRQIAEAQTCWLSVDLIRQYTTEDDAYRMIGAVLARLVPPDAAVLVHPSRKTAIAFTENVRRQLASGGQIFGTA